MLSTPAFVCIYVFPFPRTHTRTKSISLFGPSRSTPGYILLLLLHTSFSPWKELIANPLIVRQNRKTFQLNKKGSTARSTSRSLFFFPSHTHSQLWQHQLSSSLSNVYIQHAGLLSTQQARDTAAAAAAEKRSSSEKFVLLNVFAAKPNYAMLRVFCTMHQLHKALSVYFLRSYIG